MIWMHLWFFMAYGILTYTTTDRLWWTYKTVKVGRDTPWSQWPFPTHQQSQAAQQSFLCITRTDLSNSFFIHGTQVVSCQWTTPKFAPLKLRFEPRCLGRPNGKELRSEPLGNFFPIVRIEKDWKSRRVIKNKLIPSWIVYVRWGHLVCLFPPAPARNLVKSCQIMSTKMPLQNLQLQFCCKIPVSFG